MTGPQSKVRFPGAPGSGTAPGPALESLGLESSLGSATRSERSPWEGGPHSHVCSGLSRGCAIVPPGGRAGCWVPRQCGALNLWVTSRRAAEAPAFQGATVPSTFPGGDLALADAFLPMPAWPTAPETLWKTPGCRTHSGLCLPARPPLNFPRGPHPSWVFSVWDPLRGRRVACKPRPLCAPWARS